MRIERDDAVERVLRALGQAEAPEGLEARMAMGVERSERFAGRSMAAVWWRGAASGAAVAILAVGIVMVVGHLVLTPGQVAAHHGGTAVGRVAPTGAAIVGLVQRERRPVPCPGTGLSGSPDTPMQRRDVGRLEVVRQPEPMFGTTLTAEERNLVRVVQVADVKELAILNPEMRAQVEAEDAAQFQSFFAESVAKRAAAQRAAAEIVAADPGAAALAESGVAQPAAGPGAAEAGATQPAIEPATGGNQ